MDTEDFLFMLKLDTFLVVGSNAYREHLTHLVKMNHAGDSPCC